MAAQDRLYARKLARFDPHIVNAACDDWSNTEKFWPEAHSLIALCEQREWLAEVAARPRLAGPEPQPTRREPMSAERLLAAWEQNDRTADAIRANPGAYFCGPALLAAQANFRERRFREQPELATRYYGAAE